MFHLFCLHSGKFAVLGSFSLRVGGSGTALVGSVSGATCGLLLGFSANGCCPGVKINERSQLSGVSCLVWWRRVTLGTAYCAAGGRTTS